MKSLSKPLFAMEPLNSSLEKIGEARLILIGGRRGSMKLNLLYNLLQRHLDDVRHVPLFVTGTGREYLIKKFEALDLEMHQNVAYAKNDRKPVFFIDEINGWDVEKTCSQIRSLHHLFKVPFVIIDCLESFKNDDCYDFQDKMEDNIEKLRELSDFLEIPVVILSDLDKKIDERKGHKKRPALFDLYSKRLTSMLDFILLLYRPEYYQIDKWEDYSSTANQLELNFEKTPLGIAFSFKFLVQFNQKQEVVFPEIHNG